MFQSNVSHGIGRIEVGSCHARCSTSWVATIFFSKGCCIRGVFHACKGWLAAGYFRVPRFLLLCSFCYVCACMTFITCMIMHCVFLLTLTSQNLFASHSWNMHACMHASSTSCMWLGDIWLRLVLWDGSFWAGITFGYRMGQHGWGQGKSPAAFHRPGFQEQQDQTESDTQWLSSCWADYFCLKRILNTCVVFLHLLFIQVTWSGMRLWSGWRSNTAGSDHRLLCLNRQRTNFSL